MSSKKSIDEKLLIFFVCEIMGKNRGVIDERALQVIPTY